VTNQIGIAAAAAPVLKIDCIPYPDGIIGN
jgi:hypothetical protein